MASFASAIFYLMTPASTTWLHQTYSQIAISFATLAVIASLILAAGPRPEPIGRNFTLHGAIRVVALLGFMLSLAVFSIFAYITATSHGNSMSRAALLEFYSEFPLGHAVFGVFGFVFFVLASFCLTVYFLDRGILRALREVIQFFVFPALMFFELGLSVVDTSEMPRHVTMFLASTPLGGIVTNWFVLVLSSGLFIIGLI